MFNRTVLFLKTSGKCWKYTVIRRAFNQLLFVWIIERLFQWCIGQSRTIFSILCDVITFYTKQSYSVENIITIFYIWYTRYVIYGMFTSMYKIRRVIVLMKMDDFCILIKIESYLFCQKYIRRLALNQTRIFVHNFNNIKIILAKRSTDPLWWGGGDANTLSEVLEMYCN